MYNIDMLITSSSRPHLLPIMFESFKKMMIFRGKLRIVVHEDWVFPKESKQVMSYLEKLKERGEIDEICFTDPARGLGLTLYDMVRNKIKDKYFFYSQDDWFYERPVDLDELVWIMEENSNINHIYFNKIRNNGSTTGRQVHVNGVELCVSHHFGFLPGLWRTDKIRNNLKPVSSRPEGAFTNSFGSHEQRMNDDFCEENMGSYIYGGTGSFRYVRHIANDQRMAAWRLEEGKPGGRHSVDMDIPYMGPWLDYNDMPGKDGMYL